MLGRTRLFEQICNELTKPTPAHLSLVGPRFSGKTVLLEALAEAMCARSNKYQVVLYWDLGHRTPQTDADFLGMLRSQIAKAIKESHPDEANYLEEADAGYDELHEVVKLLGESNERLLLIWDGFDRPLREGTLTRNLWDNLLELCRMPAFRVVTASRRKLQELIRDANSVTSELWQVFQVVRLGPMDAGDVETFAKGLPGSRFESGALTEIMNWTGGLPALLVWLMNRVESGTGNATTNEHINQWASEPDETCTDLLEQIWGDCPAPAADFYRYLAENGPQKVGDVSKAERLALINLGLAKEHSGSIAASCRMIQSHIGGTSREFGAVARLFGTWEAYCANIRGIMERRLSQIPRIDESLFHMVERAVEDVPNHPESCLAALSQIEDRALDLVWKWECDCDGDLPTEVIADWSTMPETQQNRTVSEMMKSDEAGRTHAWHVPPDRAKQLALLQFLTGSHQVYNRSLARYAGKDTYVLLNALHSFRNRSQHAGGQKIPLGVAISAVMLCVELLACIKNGSGTPAKK